jgi:hypothetical protein
LSGPAGRRLENLPRACADRRADMRYRRFTDFGNGR